MACRHSKRFFYTAGRVLKKIKTRGCSTEVNFFKENQAISFDDINCFFVVHFVAESGSFFCPCKLSNILLIQHNFFSLSFSVGQLVISLKIFGHSKTSFVFFLT